MSEFTDHYALLGIAFDATLEEIRAAYRRLAKKYHPDLNPCDTDASSARFRLVQTAYEVLSDPAERICYDQLWRDSRNFRETAGPEEASAWQAQVPETDWQFACRYFPGLAPISVRLTKFSERVECRWRNQVFFEKAFSQADDLAQEMEEAFLGKMVGASEQLRMVARDSFLASHDRLRAELSDAVRILGLEVAEQFIEVICRSSIETKLFVPRHENTIRSEIYRNQNIYVMEDLTCYTEHCDDCFVYIFEARKSIDDQLDNAIGISSDPSINFSYSKSKPGRRARAC